MDEFEDEYEEEEAEYPGGEGDDDDDETARALSFMYNIAHGYPHFLIFYNSFIFYLYYVSYYS